MASLSFIDWNTETILNDIKAKYRTESGSALEIGSNEMAIASSIAYILGVAKDRFNEMAKQRFIETATGEYLDALGETFNLPRPDPVHASCTIQITLEKGKLIHLEPNSFIVSDANGVKFTPIKAETIQVPSYESFVEYTTHDVVCVGYQNESVTKESNIDVGAITTILTPIEGVTEVTNITRTGGARESFEHNDEGDEAYRQYLLETRNAVSTAGPAAYYEALVKRIDDRITDVKCLKYNDDGFELGKIIIYVLIYDESLTYTTKQETLNRVRTTIENNKLRPLCDDVIIRDASEDSNNPDNLIVGFNVGLSSKNFVAGRDKFLKDFDDYKKYLLTHIDAPFSLSELCRRTQTPDENGVKTEYVTLTDPSNAYVSPTANKAFFYIELNSVSFVPAD